MNELTQVNVNGIVGTVLNCPYCSHTNPPQCPKCKPFGTEICIGCFFRYDGGIPVTTTASPEPINDPPPLPTTTATASASNDPPGPSSWAAFTWGTPNNTIPPTAISNDELQRIAKRNPPPAGWQQDDSTDPTT